MGAGFVVTVPFTTNYKPQLWRILWMHERWKLFVLKNLWSEDVFNEKRREYLHTGDKKNLALYVWVNEYQRLK